MPTCRDSQTCVEIVDSSECGRLPLQTNVVGSEEAHYWDKDDHGGIQPIDVLIPVTQCHWKFRYVRLLGVVFFGPRGFVVGRSIGKGDRLGGRGG